MEKKNVSELKKEDFERLGKTISELTCKGLFWGKGLALALEKERLKFLNQYDLELFTRIKPNYEKRDFLISVISAISSTYYAASGNALSHIRQACLFSKPLWFWRAWRYLHKAEKYSDKFASLKKMEDMTLGELDVRACVLHKTGRPNEAKKLLGCGITKMKTLNIGTRNDFCLFLIHEAEILAEIGCVDCALKNYKEAMELSVYTSSFLTKVRVLRSYGTFLAERKMLGKAEDVLSDALYLAGENELYDQEIKIKAIFKNFKLAIR